MLSREVAQKALAEVALPDPIGFRTERLADLNEDLRRVGELLLADVRNYRTFERGVKAVGALSAEARSQLFMAIFGQIGEYVFLAYESLMPTLPFRGGYSRRAFRSDNLQHHEENRQSWLSNLIRLTHACDQPLSWYAAWASYFSYSADPLSLLFAAAINRGDETGQEVFVILCDSARGEHEVGAMGRHVVRSLLMANRPEGWQLMENMLVAAQRQEGLRQSILESVDEAHPQAFARMLRVIVEQNMVRFSATVRAADVWFGLNWDVEHKRQIQDSLEQVLCLLENPAQGAEQLQSDEPTQVFIALWVLAFNNIALAIEAAQPLLQDARAEHRFVAAYLLRMLGVSDVVAVLAPSLADEDLRVAVQAFRATQHLSAGPLKHDWFETLEAFLQRFSAKQTQVEALVWPWMSESVSQGEIVGELGRVRGNRSVRRLIPYLDRMTVWDRLKVAEQLVKNKEWDEETRGVLFGLLRDRSSQVREGVIEHLRRHNYVPETSAEVQKFESLLTRKAADLRRGVILLLLRQNDEQAAESARRLLSAAKAPQRLAGLELLERLQKTERVDCRDMAAAYAEQRPKRSASEQTLLDQLLDNEQAVPTLEDALGLTKPSQRSQAVAPKAIEDAGRRVQMISASTRPILEAIDGLLQQHRTEPVEVVHFNGSTEELLGNLHWFPQPDGRKSRAENLQQLPLASVWQAWWEGRAAELRDEDGMELPRAIASFSDQSSVFSGHLRYFSPFGQRPQNPAWVDDLKQQYFAKSDELTSSLINEILSWLHYLYPPKNESNFLLKAAQITLADIDKAASQAKRSVPFDWRESDLLGWLTLAQMHRRQHPEQWTPSQVSDLWQLLRWIEQPEHRSLPRWIAVESDYGQGITLSTDGSGEVKQFRPDFDDLLAAFQVGAATEHDVYGHLLDGQSTGFGLFGGGFSTLQQLTRRKPHPLLKAYPALVPIVDRCRDRILTIESTRGELPTAATAPALSLSSITGSKTVIRLLQNFGKEKFARGWLRDSQSRSSVFSHLFRVSFPAESDTPESFANQIKAAELEPQRLIEFAVYAPQWARYVEHALKWPNLAESVWWFHAHTKDNAWQVDPEIRELWSAQIAELTPLSSQDLIDGAVDVAWFQRIYKRLKPERWAMLDEAAKYASGGGGHKRAQLFADAMTRQTERAVLVQRIQGKRHQDAVRALGLLPLAKGKKGQRDLLERYEMIQDFVRASRTFGSQRQTSEKLAARIGLENLARTAGYPDPQRLEWAMEREAIAHLAKGPISVTEGEVTVSLSITAAGVPQLSVVKKGKTLKNVPAKLKKHSKIQALQARKRAIARQASRIRNSLEQSMCRGDIFTGDELKALLTHPILRPVLAQLVFVEDGGAACGCPRDGVLQGVQGTGAAIAAKMRLRIAHPHDLAESKNWHLWQQYCFTTQQVQPFKQIFRELYVPTPQEQQGQDKGSVRYAGQQVNPRQSVALLGQRGWVAHPEEGIRRTFHDENLLVWLEFEEGWYTPAEVEGLTLNHVSFADRRTYKQLDLSDVPPRVFSEVMRDLDLVVSVAHQGGVDPETSASTVEMRVALLRETSRLLKLENIQIQEPHALIEGQIGRYTLHLGSATVHRQPGGALCIVPVRSQHRGRVFLPFADDDPKTAEVISKALLLAQDAKIQDPTILEQLL